MTDLPQSPLMKDDTTPQPRSRLWRASSQHATRWTLLGFSLLSGLCLLSSEPKGIASPSFQKGASQFCVANLSAQQQSAVYSRILSLGASFSHGCMACEAVKNWQGYTEMTDDQFWIRRNYLSHFFDQVAWKDRDAFRYENLFVFENDGRTKPAALVSQAHLRRFGYTGEWLLRPSSGAFGFVSQAMRDKLLASDPDLASETAKFGGPYLQKGKISIREGEAHGILMRTVPGAYAAAGAVPRSVYDLSIDGGFLGTLFAVHGDEGKAAALEKGGWRDEKMRDELVQLVARRLAELDPTLVITVDVLFWDTVFEALHRLRESGPKSPLVRLALGIVGFTPIGKQMFDPQRRLNQRADLFKALSLVSRGFEGRQPVPILLARLADDPIAKFREKKYMPVLATIFGQFFEQVTGVNLINQLLFWLGKITLMPDQPGFASGGLVRGGNGQINVPELGLTLSREDVSELRQTLKTIEAQLPAPEDEDTGDSEPAAGPQSVRFNNTPDSNVRFSFDPVGGSKVTLFPSFTTGIVGRILIGVLVDIPGFVKGLDDTFREINAEVARVNLATDNNVHELDVNEFYENLGYFLNPRTAHPSVLGAIRMARMVEKTTCGGRSL